MAEPDLVMLLYNIKSCLIDQLVKDLAIIHLAVAVGNIGKVQGSHLKGKGRCSKALAVPESFIDENTGMLIGNTVAFSQDGHDLFIRKAIQELAHPDRIVPLGKFQLRVQDIVLVVAYPSGE